MNYEPEVIRARFVEAAHTERFLPAARGPGSGSYWPVIFHDQEDKDGWDDAAREDNAEKWKGRASSGAISRHQECMIWTATIISDEKRRHILWAWAFCRANGWDFGARCIRKGWARPTAYRRLSASIEAICLELRSSNIMLRMPDEKWLRQETPSIVPIDGGLANCASAPATKFSPGYQTEKSSDLIKTQDDMDTFAKFLERRNARLRKLNAWRDEKVAS